MSEPISKHLKLYVDKCKPQFEFDLMKMLISDINIFNNITRQVININYIESDTHYGYDFTKPIDNILYKLIYRYYMSQIEVGVIKGGIGKNTIKMLLTGLYESKDINPDEYEIGKERLNTLYESLCEKGGEAIVKQAFSYWINTQRTKQITNKVSNSRKSKTLSDLSLEIEKELKNVESVSSSSIETMEDIFNPEKEYQIKDEDIPKRYGIGINLVDNNLVGGVGKGESLLVVLPSGGGKTVFCCQMAAYNASLGNDLLFITTEQPPRELIPRMFSNMCSIPFVKVRDGMDFALSANVLDEEELVRVKECSNLISSSISFSWWKGGDKLIEKDLEPELKQYETKHGKLPDLVIFDWLGAAIDQSWRGKANSSQRDSLKFSAKYYTDLMRKYNIAGVITMQADENLSKKAARITADLISESKNIHQNVTLGVGISALRTNREEAASTGKEYRDKQFLTNFKARKIQAFTMPIFRDFNYQRFTVVEPTKSKRITHNFMNDYKKEKEEQEYE